MRTPAAVDHDELLVVARGRDRAVAGQQALVADLVGPGRVADADEPALAAWGRPERVDVAASVNQRSPDAGPAKRRDRLIDDVALADGAEVHTHPFPAQARRASLGVHLDGAMAHESHGLGALLLRRQPVAPVAALVEPHQRPDGHIEGPARLRRDLARASEDRDQTPVNRHGLAAGQAVDLRGIAVLPPRADGRLGLLDACEGGRDRFPAGFLGRRVDRHRHVRAHGHAGLAHPHGRRGTCRRVRIARLATPASGEQTCDQDGDRRDPSHDLRLLLQAHIVPEATARRNVRSRR